MSGIPDLLRGLRGFVFLHFLFRNNPFDDQTIFQTFKWKWPLHFPLLLQTTGCFGFRGGSMNLFSSTKQFKESHRECNVICYSMRASQPARYPSIMMSLQPNKGYQVQKLTAGIFQIPFSTVRILSWPPSKEQCFVNPPQSNGWETFSCRNLSNTYYS